MKMPKQSSRFGIFICYWRGKYLNRTHFICTGTFLALTYLEFNVLAFIQRCKTAACLNRCS